MAVFSLPRILLLRLQAEKAIIFSQKSLDFFLPLRQWCRCRFVIFLSFQTAKLFISLQSTKSVCPLKQPPPSPSISQNLNPTVVLSPSFSSSASSPPPQFQFQLTSKQLPPPRATKSVASSLKGSGVNELLPPPQRCFQAQMNLFRSLVAGNTALGCCCRGACALSALGTAAPHTIPWRRRRRTTTTRNQQIKTSSSLDPAPKWRGGESIGGGRGGHKVKPATAKAASASPSSSSSSSSYSDVISLSRIFLLFPIRFSSLPP